MLNVCAEAQFFAVDLFSSPFRLVGSLGVLHEASRHAIAPLVCSTMRRAPPGVPRATEELRRTATLATALLICAAAPISFAKFTTDE